MMTTKTSGVLSRLACTMLAFLMVVTVAPCFAIESEAAETTFTPVSLFYDFESGTVGESLAKEYFNNEEQGFTGGKASNLYFYYDPAVETTDENTNIVVGNTGTNANFTLVDGNALLLGNEITIEADFYIKDAYPVKSDEGTILSLIALNNGSSNYPLVRVSTEGMLQMRQSGGSYTDTGVKMSINTWHTVKVIADPLTPSVYLYLDGVYVYNLKMISLSAIKNIRILQGNGTWQLFVDDLSISTRKVSDYVYDEIIDFEQFTDGTKLTGVELTDSVAPNLAVSNHTSYCTAVADPADENNIVAYGSNMGYKIHEPGGRLKGKDFVLSGDFRFEQFPKSTVGSVGNVSFFAWVTNDSKYDIFCGVDENGNFMTREGSTYISTGIVLQKDTWYNVAVHYDASSGKNDVYLDGSYVGSGKTAAVTEAPTASYVRVLNNYQNSYKVYADNIQIYTLTYTDTPKVPADGVIWDVDFEQFADGTKLTKQQVYDLSDISDCYTTASWVTKGQIATYNGSKAIKISNLTSEQQLDLYVGAGMYEPLKGGTVRLAFDFTVDTFDTAGTKLQLIGWRKFGLNGKSAATARIVDMSSTGVITFCGTATDVQLELDKTYNIELIVNNQVLKGVQYTDITFKIDGKTIVSSYPLWKDSQIAGALKGGNEGYAYILDDAGNKCYLPFEGIAKSYVYDDLGNPVTDGAGNNVLVDRLLKTTTANPDAFRLFQGGSSASAGSIYYVDNLIVEQLEDGSVYDFGFDGWPTQGVTASGDNGINNVTGGRMKAGSASFVTEDTGNTYLLLPSATSQQTIPVGDKNMIFYGKNVIFSSKILLPATSSAAKASFISIVYQTDLTDPYGYNSSTTKFYHPLYADGSGNLYVDGNNNPVAKLKVGEWTDVQIALTGDGEEWNSFAAYVGGKYVGGTTFKFNNVKTYYLRFKNIQETTLGVDDVSIKEYRVPTDPLYLSFDDETELSESLARLGAGWQYGAIDSTRTDRAGATVKNTELLGTDDKYLHVNHEMLTGNLNAYLDVVKDNFINNETYIIETSVRYSSSTAYSLNVAELYRAEIGESAPLLTVRGDTNKMFISLRGVQRDLVNRAGNAIYAAKTTDESFTDIAILVNEASDTFTLYVGGRLAYYEYNGEALPCVDLPMHFITNETTASGDFIRLLEIPKVKFAESLLDVAYVNVYSAPNGMSTEIKGSQTRTVAGTATFDVRFVSGIDSLYASKVGYEITAEYTDADGAQTKSEDISSNLVFSSIEADSETVTAESQDSKYLAAISVNGIDSTLTVKFTVKPYVDRGGVKIYGETYVVTFANGEIAE